jgi:hypothetical protein
MTPRDLVAGCPLSGLVGRPEADPLTEKDALQEARLNEVLFDAVNMRAGFLFDLRGALAFRMPTTGLLVVGGVEKLRWDCEPRSTIRTAWAVVGSVPANKDGVVSLRLFFSPDAEMTVAGRSAAFFAGDVPGLPDRVPDFAWSDAEVAAGMASMDSLFEPTHATFIEPLS